MLNHPNQFTKTKYCKFLVKPSPIKQSKQNIQNIFSPDKSNIFQDLHDIKKDQNNLHLYEVCGDQQFKAKFFQNKSKSKEKLNQQQINIYFPQNQKPKLSFNHTTAQFFNKLENHKIQQTIYMNSSQRQTFLSTLHKTQKNIMNRQQQSLQKFKETQKSWQRIDSYLKFKQLRNQTVTFGSVKKVYAQQNPQKLEIINDMLPNYWRNSLRSNDKKLKSHIKDHKFKHQIAEQMLQTLKGTRRLQSSIPRIGLERVHKDFVNSDKVVLKAKPIVNEQGYEKMRQFHKTMHKTLNETIKQRSLMQQNKRSKSKSSIFMSTNRTMQVRNIQPIDLSQQLTNKQRQLYNFCRRLQELDRVDNEIYVKSYEKKKKWIHQGFEIGE